MRGLQASARGNAPAYGYSVTLTATSGVLSSVQGTPGVLEVFLFAADAIVGFALVEAAITGGFRHGLEDEPSTVKALGGSISVLSVGGALAGAFAAGELLGASAWPLGAFLTTMLYLCLFALEISIAHRLKSGSRRR